MTAEADKPSAAADQPSQAAGRNDLLRRSRLRRRSPSNPALPMSQRELAEAVTAHVQRATGRDVAVDRHVISRWERGKRRFPIADYRDALRAVLGVATDAELGFGIMPWATPPRPVAATALANTTDDYAVQPKDTEETTAQLSANPGPAVVLASATPELLNAVVPLLAALKSYHGGDEPSPTTVGTV